MNRGGNYREGYVCEICVKDHDKNGRSEPDKSLYTRDRFGFHHAGLVICSKHWIQKAKRLKDL